MDWLKRVRAYEDRARAEGLEVNLIVNSERGGQQFGRAVPPRNAPDGGHLPEGRRAADPLVRAELVSLSQADRARNRAAFHDRLVKAVILRCGRESTAGSAGARPARPPRRVRQPHRPPAAAGDDDGRRPASPASTTRPSRWAFRRPSAAARPCS